MKYIEAQIVPVSLIVSLGCMAYSIYLTYKLKKIGSTIDASVSELSIKTPIEVKETIVEAATQKAVDREVEQTARIAIRRLSDEIKQQVKTYVDSAYTDIRKSVSDEIATQVQHINMTKLEDDVVKKAKEAIAEKFDSKLDYLLDEFNSNLNNVSKIYRSITKSITAE